MMNARVLSLQLIVASLLSLALLPSTAAAAASIDPEKQPIYVNIMNSSLCGTDPAGPQPPSPCQVPAGYRLIFEHVSGYAFRPTSTDTTLAVSLAIKDPQLGLGGIGEAAFHSFVATKIPSVSAVSDTFVFSTPFKIMLHSGATFYFSPADNVAVSGYLVKE